MHFYVYHPLKYHFFYKFLPKTHIFVHIFPCEIIFGMHFWTESAVQNSEHYVVRLFTVSWSVYKSRNCELHQFTLKCELKWIEFCFTLNTRGWKLQSMMSQSWPTWLPHLALEAVLGKPCPAPHPTTIWLPGASEALVGETPRTACGGTIYLVWCWIHHLLRM